MKKEVTNKKQKVKKIWCTKSAMKKKATSGITLIALVITIIVLLVLASVTIATLIGENGIVTNAILAKRETEKAAAKEKVQLATLGSYDLNGNFNYDELRDNLNKIEGISGVPELINDDSFPLVVMVDGYAVQIENERTITTIDISIPNEEVEEPEGWDKTYSADKTWYSYGGDKINAPKLTGLMTPIKYSGEMAKEENKWANAITSDGSMWVWIPRFAYKITEGYHSNTTGTIEVAFIGKDNKFLNVNDKGEITTNPKAQGAGTTVWLVHPTFTANADNGGGFGELDGIWVGKFEATGSSTNLSVKPGIPSLREMTINEQYQLAKASTFGENVDLGSHMAKNSEWGATVYLAHSQYGTKGKEVERSLSGPSYSGDTLLDGNNYYTGGTNQLQDIYEANKLQSTTHNATGIYDINGGAWERLASYVNSDSNDYLKDNGGQAQEDLYGATAEEQSTSTKYKTVYSKGTNIQQETQEIRRPYYACENVKGDAIWETSSENSVTSGAWFGTFSNFSLISSPFLIRGRGNTSITSGIFSYRYDEGMAAIYTSFRPVLAF